MTELQLALLGRPKIELDGVDITGRLFRHPRAAWAFVYLVTKKQRISRAELAFLLWPDETRARALSNLRGRSGLLALRQLGLDAFVDSSHKEWISAKSDLIVNDLDLFAAQQQDATEIAQLRRMASHIRGQFCESMPVPNGCDTLEDWVEIERINWHRRAIEALSQLANLHLRWHELSDVREVANQLISLDPRGDTGYRYMLLADTYSGSIGQARAQARRLASLAERDYLAISFETQQLIDDVQQDVVDVPVPPPLLAPLPPTHFVERDALTARVLDGLKPENGAIVALVGMGGSGKTTLASYIGHLLRYRYYDGVLWANPRAQDWPATFDVWEATFSRTNTTQRSLARRQTAARTFARNRRILVIIDDPDLQDLKVMRNFRPVNRRSAVLFTSRDTTLANALNATLVEMPLLGEVASLQLLRNLVGGDRVDAERKTALDICHQVGFLPLALELVGQRLRGQPRTKLADVAARLEKARGKLDHLAFADRGIRASIQLSWDRLSAELQTVMAACAVFNGRWFNADALAAVLDCSASDADSALNELANHSLVWRREENGYQQHALLVEFGQEQLQNRQAAAQRMADYYLQLAQQAEQEPVDLTPHWPNLRATLYALSEQAAWQPVIELVNALLPFWFARGLYDAARDALPLACQAAEAQASDDQLAWMRLQLGKACLYQSSLEEAHHYLSESEQIYSARLKNPSMSAQAAQVLAQLYERQGELASARTRLLQCKAVWEASEQPDRVAQALYGLSRISFREGDFDRSLELCRQALALQNEGAPVQDAVRCAILEARILNQIDNKPAAVERIVWAMGQANPNDLVLASELSDVYGQLLTAQKAWDAAAFQTEQFIGFARQFGDLLEEYRGLMRLAQIQAGQSFPDDAVATADEALAIGTAEVTVAEKVADLTLVAERLIDSAEDDHARSLLERALLLAESATLAEPTAHIQQQLARLA